MNYIELVSIICAALTVAFGSIGPALAEGRAVAAAMDAIARQPEAAGTVSRTGAATAAAAVIAGAATSATASAITGPGTGRATSALTSASAGAAGAWTSS